jgi:hypothetical protein
MQGEFGEISEREEFLSGGKTSAYMGRDGLANRLSTSAEGRPAYPHHKALTGTSQRHSN